MSIVLEEPKKLLDSLPNQASWDDIMYEIYVKKKIDEGLKAADEGKLILHDEVKKRFLQK